MDPDQYSEAAGRLEQEYLAGGMSADEYTRRRRQLEETGSLPDSARESAAELEPASTLAPMPRLSEVDSRAVQPGADPITGAALASWGRRAGAWFIDSALYVGAFVVLSLFLPSDTETGEVSDAGAGVIVVLFLFGPTIYAWLMVGRWGMTLGKMAVGIKVVRSEDGSRVSYLRALGRAASVWVLGLLFLPLLLAYLWPLWDRRNQTIYDKMASTIVVKVDSGPTGFADVVS